MQENRGGGTVLGVGVAVLDLISTVESYPGEDAEVRALAHWRRRGGNATNTLTVLAQFGHACRWCGVLGDDPAAAEILADLVRHDIDCHAVRRIAAGVTPTSFILLARDTASRTIVHYRDLPELSATDFSCVSLEGVDWVHFEGRAPEQTREMMARVRRESPHTRISLELEKRRPGIETLLDGPHLLLTGRAYAEACGYHRPEELLQDLSAGSSATALVCAWGGEGAVCLEPGRSVQRLPAWSPAEVIDTLGAGDCLNAGVIHGLLQGRSLEQAVDFAVHLAGCKCAQHGLVGLGEAARNAGLC